MPVPMIETDAERSQVQRPEGGAAGRRSASSRSSSRDFLVKRPILSADECLESGGARLGSAERIGTGLAKSRAIGAGRQAGVLLEGSRRNDSDRRTRRRRRCRSAPRTGELPHREFDAQLADVGRERRLMDAAERPRQVDGVHADLARDRRKRQPIREMQLDESERRLQPQRRGTADLPNPPRRLRKQRRASGSRSPAVTRRRAAGIRRTGAAPDAAAARV